MTVGEIKNEVMFQTNNDIEDVEEYLPYLLGYINEGYDKLLYSYTKEHAGESYPMMESDDETPMLPEWSHRALADYATWLVYRNGNPQKQNRGMAFLSAFNEMVSKLNGLSNGPFTNFFNIPR